MGIHGNAFLSLFFLLIVIFGSFEVSFARTKAVTFPSKAANVTVFNHRSFPPNFAFGASSAAYQYEGAAKEDGRGVSVWDVFSHKYPERITDHTTGDVALDFYHRYKDDIKLMKFIGLNSFRLSISWPRVIPTGKVSEGVNPKGIAFYNSLINELLANGIQPYVTIFHWDLPQKLQDEYMGILSPKLTKDWVDFADLCFREFGDRVKHWATVNEPWNLAFLGHDVGSVPPMRCSAWRNAGCLGGDSGTEPYIAAHQLIISHAHVVKLYREKYKPTQKGQIGIVLNPNWYVPYSNDPADVEAAYRSIDFNYGWFLEPLVLGQYPKTMQQNVGNRLPKFTPEEVQLVKGSLDFLGINYYTSNFAKDAKVDVGTKFSSATDIQAEQTTARNGVPIGEPTGVSIFFVYPDGLEKILVYTKHKYGDVPIYITENGMGQANIETVEEGIDDRQRVRFYQGHLKAVKAAIDQGVNVKGYFGWSFLDTWEWTSGFTSRFGINFVDYKNNLKRHPKLSAMYYKKFLE